MNGEAELAKLDNLNAQFRASAMCAIHFDKTPEITNERPLEVKWIDLHVETNSVAHQTHRFDGIKRLKELPYLAIRRGQEFFVTVNFYRDFNPITDQVKLIFELGKRRFELLRLVT